MKGTVLLVYDPFFAAPPKIDFAQIETLPTEDDLRESPEFLYLNIDAWTSLQDIKEAFGDSRKLQHRIFGYRAEEKPNFGRDLSWYDLHHGFHYSYKKIGYLWYQFLPDELIDLIKPKKGNKDLPESELNKVIKEYVDSDEFRQIIKSAVKRIEKAIKNLSPSPYIISFPPEES